jgi:hypothetical protein
MYTLSPVSSWTGKCARLTELFTCGSLKWVVTLCNNFKTAFSWTSIDSPSHGLVFCQQDTCREWIKLELTTIITLLTSWRQIVWNQSWVQLQKSEMNSSDSKFSYDYLTQLWNPSAASFKSSIQSRMLIKLDGIFMTFIKKQDTSHAFKMTI